MSRRPHRTPSRASSRGGSRVSEGGDDAISMTTLSLGESAEDNLDDGTDIFPDQMFKDSIEQLYEKSSSSRQIGLQKLASVMSSHWQFDDCMLNEATLTQMFLRIIKKGVIAEVKLACQALGLHVVTLGAGDESERAYRDAIEALSQPVLTSKSPEARAAIADCLGILCFVGSEGAEDTLECMQLFWRCLGAQATVQISALRVWTLLLSTLPKKFLHPSFVESSLAMLGKLLHDSDVAVRSCAGEALALLFDLSGLANLEDDTAHDHPSPSRTVPNPSSRPPRPSTMSQARPTDAESSDESPTDLERAYRGSDSEAVHVESILSRMKDLSKSHGEQGRQNRKDRSALRSTFRDVLRSIEESVDGGGTSTHKVGLKNGDTVVVDTLSGSIQLDVLRRFLGHGFQPHMQQNPLLHEVFNFKPRAEPAQKLSSWEKRMYRSSSSAESKTRSQNRRRDREVMSSYKTGQFTPD